MNAHHTTITDNAMVRMPASDPPASAASRIAGKYVVKGSVGPTSQPNTARATVARPTQTTASAKARHGPSGRATSAKRQNEFIENSFPTNPSARTLYGQFVSSYAIAALPGQCGELRAQPMRLLCAIRVLRSLASGRSLLSGCGHIQGPSPAADLWLQAPVTESARAPACYAESSHGRASPIAPRRTPIGCWRRYRKKISSSFGPHLKPFEHGAWRPAVRRRRDRELGLFPPQRRHFAGHRARRRPVDRDRDGRPRQPGRCVGGAGRQGVAEPGHRPGRRGRLDPRRRRCCARSPSRARRSAPC